MAFGRSKTGRLIISAFLLLLGATVWAQDAPDRTAGGGRLAVVGDVEGVIGPANARHVNHIIETASARGAELLILRLNTPGGLATSMREIITAILRAPMPIAGFVAPPGSRAASAGTYILYATDIAAMAPGTNIGAATPVQIGGMPGMPGSDKPAERKPAPEKEGEGAEDSGEAASGDNGTAESGGAEKPQPAADGDPMKAKAVNDAVAFIRSLAEMHGRNPDWAEKAVTEAATLSAEQALAENVINFVAGDVDALVRALDGFSVEIGGTERTLKTEGMRVEQVEPTLITKILRVVTNPNVALVLMMLGVYGLIFELANPGIGPGVPGIICLLIGLYALNQLPLDYAGLALIALGVAFMVGEAITPTFGILGLGGVAAFTIGAAMLIETDVPEYQVSWTLIAVLAVLSGLTLTLLLGYLWKTMRRKVRTGLDTIAGSPVEVLDWQGGRGHVRLQGERWAAQGSGPFQPGDKATVTKVEGLTVEITPRAQNAEET